MIANRFFRGNWGERRNSKPTPPGNWLTVEVKRLLGKIGEKAEGGNLTFGGKGRS